MIMGVIMFFGFRAVSFFIIIFIFSKSSWAKNGCEEINFYQDPLNPLQQMEVCDQGPLGVCYAVSAAQLINYQIIEAPVTNATQAQGQPQKSIKVHPLWIAYLYKGQNKGFSGGLTDESANVIRKHGVCPSLVVEKSIKDFIGTAWMNGYQLFCLIENLESNWSGEKQVRQAYQQAHQKCMGWSSFNEDIYGSIIAIMTDSRGIINRPSSHEIVREVFSGCYEPGVIQKKKIKKIEAECDWCTDSEVKEKISKNLRKNKMVGIDYCAEVLEDKAFVGIEDGRNSNFQFTPRGFKIKDSKKCGNHASVLVGQKEINNKCHFLLRNSWGTRKYREWPNCICEEYNGNIVDCKYGQAPYKSVSCWVGADELAKNTYRIIKY